MKIFDYDIDLNKVENEKNLSKLLVDFKEFLDTKNFKLILDKNEQYLVQCLFLGWYLMDSIIIK